MKIHLTPSETEEMLQRADDVSGLMTILRDDGREEMSPQAVFKAWSEHSERSAAGWLMPSDAAEVVRAYDAFLDRKSEERLTGVDYGAQIDRNSDAMLARIARHRDVSTDPAPVVVSRRFSPSDFANGSAVAKLKAIGFAPDISKDRSEATLTRMGHVAGRLKNVEYMAHAIDAADGIPLADRAPRVDGGQRQYDYMTGEDAKGELRDTGRCYVALRRVQRSGDEAKLRVGLVMLVAADHGEIGMKDVLASLGDDGMPKVQAREVSTDGPQVRRSAVSPSKGPSVDSQPSTLAAAFSRAGAER